MPCAPSTVPGGGRGFRLYSQMMRATSRPMAMIPPRLPPTIAPIGGDEDEDDEEWLGAGPVPLVGEGVVSAVSTVVTVTASVNTVWSRRSGQIVRQS